MAYNNVISRTDQQALVPEVVSNDLLQGVIGQSAALSLFRKITMPTNQTRMPVLSAFPTAYFVNGDTGLKQTTEQAWSNKYLNVEEIAAIVPIPEAVLDDTSYDIWGEIRPRLEEAIGRLLDAAVFFGVSKPSSWPAAIVPAAQAVTGGVNSIQRGTDAAALGGLAGDISAVFGAVESEGFDVNGIIANVVYKGMLRQVRSTQGVQLQEVTTNSAYGIDITYPMRGLWPTGSGAAELVAGDFTNGIIGMRQDVTYKVLDQAVIQDNTGAIMFNLAQQDMVALRVVARFGFQVANIIRYDQLTEANRYPFAVLHAA